MMKQFSESVFCSGSKPAIKQALEIHYKLFSNIFFKNVDTIQ